MLKQTITNQKGIATMESTLLLTIFVVFMTYCIGFFGVVHTGILNSIAARAYAFETFRNRANVVYFRDSLDQTVIEHYARFGYRAHGILSEKAPRGQSGSEWFVTDRSIAQGRESPPITQRPNPNQMDQLPRRETSGVNPVWLKTTYGICLNERCGDS